MNKDSGRRWTQIKISRWWIYGPLVVFVIVLLILNVGHDARKKSWMRRVLCATNIHYLGKAMDSYRLENEGQYPSAISWCDILVTDCNVPESAFVCKAAVAVGDKGPCHYAMNPNCQPDSPNDVVLLFETKGGWNQHGGPELLTLENHENKGCNVLFADGHVEWIKAEDVGKLNWGTEAKQNE